MLIFSNAFNQNFRFIRLRKRTLGSEGCGLRALRLRLEPANSCGGWRAEKAMLFAIRVARGFKFGKKCKVEGFC